MTSFVSTYRYCSCYEYRCTKLVTKLKMQIEFAISVWLKALTTPLLNKLQTLENWNFD